MRYIQSDLFVLLQLQMQILNERKKKLALTRLHSDTELAQFEWMTSKRVKKSHCLQTWLRDESSPGEC